MASPSVIGCPSCQTHIQIAPGTASGAHISCPSCQTTVGVPNVPQPSVPSIMICGGCQGQIGVPPGIAAGAQIACPTCQCVNSVPGSTAPIHAPAPAPVNQKSYVEMPDCFEDCMERQGLCGCLNDPGNCLMTWCCPCITMGQNAERAGESMAVYCCGWLCVAYCTGCGHCIMSWQIREKIRKRVTGKNQPKTIQDLCAHCCCMGCAICQETRIMDMYNEKNGQGRGSPVKQTME